MNKNDIKLILILLLLISLSLIIINKTKKEGTTAIVYYENKEILKIDMNLDKEYTVQGLLGDVVIEVKENKIRVTFDNHIVSTESCFDLFSENLNMNPVLDPYNVVLEVKFNGFLLEYIKRMINPVNRSELSVSKYVLARQNGYQTRL